MWERWQKKRTFVRALEGTYGELKEELYCQPRVYKTSDLKWKGGPRHFGKKAINPQANRIARWLREGFGVEAETLVGVDHVIRDMDPSMGAEDFSFMLQVKPGAYLRIGQGGEGSCMLHNSRYDFNDEILPLGSALHASLVERAMPLAQR